MATIIAGRFQQQSEAEEVMEELLRAGFPREGISIFYCNPPGRHDAYPIGGDHDRSPGAKETGKGVATGVAAGAAAGIAATPVLGPLGPVTGGLLGAHIGGLVGGLSKMKEKGDLGEHGDDVENAAPLRRDGVMVAIAVGDDEHEERAIHALRVSGAADIERAQGTVENGDWVDFNPVEPPVLVEYGQERRTPDMPHRRV